MATVASWHYVKPRSMHVSVSCSGNMNEQYYKECVEQAANYNARLSAERRMRLPFLDAQTGVAQNHTRLWMPYRYRGPGEKHGQLYTYPAKRWKMKQRAYQMREAAQLAKTRDSAAENGDTEKKQLQIRHQVNSIATEKKIVSEEHKISAVENPVVEATEETSRDQWYDDLDGLSDPPDAGEIDDNSSSSDFEDSYIKKKKKKKKPATKGRGRKKEKEEPKIKKDYDPEDPDKPYGCELCGARYKTRPGLTYHLSHFHSGADEDEDGGNGAAAVTPSPAKHQQGDGPAAVTTNTAGDVVDANNYCDFCLGDESKNKKTGKKEELVTCSECGRAGHPSCLQFTPNMIISVKKYRWQCIECKSCGLCGTSDNDDQLLFCDDCDRGYHMYCLNPPLSEPPEGSWSCHLCIIEFYGGKKPEGMA